VTGESRGDTSSSADGVDTSDWASLAEAVAAAAYRVEDRAGVGFDGAAGDTGMRAAATVDAAIAAVERRRRLPSRPPDDDVPLDRRLLDGQTLRDLGEFLRFARRGLLTRQEIVHEARLWRRLLAAGWPSEARDAPPLARGLELLSALPDAEGEPVPAVQVEPADDLERALAEVNRDETARPRLWQALHDGELVLPVVAYELVRPEGANLQFLTAPIAASPLVFGFTSEERFDALLPEGPEMSRVTPRGRDLPRFWPDGHWLMINPGYADHVVLSPWEVKGLPGGARSELPHPRAVRIEPPAADDPRRPALVDVLRTIPGVDHVVWARVRPTHAGEGAPWQDLLVVVSTGLADPDNPDGAGGPGASTVAATGLADPDEPGAQGSVEAAGEAAAVNALSAVLPRDLFPRAAVVARQPGLAHPFVEAVVAAGHRVDA
jgi:type III secretion system (T3SS) SseB-like protein